MSGAFVPGASGEAGTEDATHFNHQPPIIDTFGGNSDPPSPHDHGTNTHHEALARPPIELTRPSRAHFPDEISQLEKRITGPEHLRSESSLDSAKNEKEKNAFAHRGIWQHFKDFWNDLMYDFGSHEAHHHLANLMGDSGIDFQTLRKLRNKSGLSSLVGSSLLLSGPGLGHRGSTPSVSVLGLVLPHP